MRIFKFEFDYKVFFSYYVISFLTTMFIFAMFMMAMKILSYTHFDNYLVEFVEKPCFKPTNYYYRTCSDMKVKVDNNTILIPQGFRSDLDSIPRILWYFVAQEHQAFVLPAVMHDYLYTCPGNLTRSEVDDIFYSGLISEGVTKFAAFQTWLAVRVFGATHFYNKTYACPTHPYVAPIPENPEAKTNSLTPTVEEKKKASREEIKKLNDDDLNDIWELPTF
jgi:Protein of unknown function (DUF1353)